MTLPFMPRAKARSLAVCALALCALFAATAVPADDHEAPGADEIIARHIEAIGGEDAIRAHTSSTTTGTFEMPAMGMSGDLTVYQQAPDMGLVRIVVPGFGENIQAYNGQIGWSEDPTQGSRLLEGAELNALKRQSSPHAELEYKEHFPERTTIGEAEWNGEAAWQVDLVDVDGNESSRYYSKDTGLLLGEETTQTTDMGPTEATNTLADYTEFGGLMVATTTITNLVSIGMEFVLNIESVTFDNVDPSVFEPSEAIKALLPE